jgi:hypothetical protein
MMRFEYPGVTRHQAMRDHLRKIFKADGGTVEDLDDNEIAAPEGKATRHLSELADLLTEASDGEVDRPAALRWLMHHRDGRALVAQLHKHEKGFPMPDRADELELLVRKAGSFTHFCKAISGGRTGGITEKELSLMAEGYAMREFPHLAPEQAFNRKFGDARSTEAARAFWSARSAITGL